jgi:hypothetical protein
MSATGKGGRLRKARGAQKTDHTPAVGNASQVDGQIGSVTTRGREVKKEKWPSGHKHKIIVRSRRRQ